MQTRRADSTARRLPFLHQSGAEVGARTVGRLGSSWSEGKRWSAKGPDALGLVFGAVLTYWIQASVTTWPLFVSLLLIAAGAAIGSQVPRCLLAVWTFALHGHRERQETFQVMRGFLERQTRQGPSVPLQSVEPSPQVTALVTLYAESGLLLARCPTDVYDQAPRGLAEDVDNWERRAAAAVPSNWSAYLTAEDPGGVGFNYWRGRVEHRRTMLQTVIEHLGGTLP